MEPSNSNPEADRWLSIAVKLLTAHDFLGSKTFAYRAREADPNNFVADQILAIVDTLLAAEKRINNQYDWYSILQLAHLIRDPELIVNQYRRLLMFLGPERNGLPFADHALRLVVDAWSVLSDPTKKWLYDSELSLFLQRLESQQQQQAQAPPPVVAAPQRVDSVRGGSAQLNTFQFFQPLPQTQPQPPTPPQPPQPQPPQWQQPQQRVQEPHQHPLPQQQQPVWQQRSQPLAPAQQQHPQPPASHQQQHQPQQYEYPPPQPFQLPQTRSFPNLQNPLQSLRQQQQEQQQQQPPPRQPQQEQPQQEQQPQPQLTVQNEETPTQENVVRRNEGSGVDINRTVTAPSEEPDAPRFWTACPYCYYIFEYLQTYLDCTLRCQNCKRAFHASPVPNPPPIVDGKEQSSFCCWGFYPLGFSMTKWKKSDNNLETPDGSNWVPFSPMFTCPVNGNGGPMPNGYAAEPVKKNVGARPGVRGWIYKDDDDLFEEVSESSGNSDSSGDWGISSYKKKKKKKRTKSATTTGKKRGRPPKKPLPDSSENIMNDHNSVPETEVVNAEKLQDESGMQQGVTQASNAQPNNVDVSKKAGGSNTRKQTGRGVKSRKKLDLNVEFSNEVEEHATTMSAGNGTEEGIEGISFFEGLDEFLSTLPMLNGVGDDKVKPS